MLLYKVNCLMIMISEEDSREETGVCGRGDMILTVELRNHGITELRIDGVYGSKESLIYGKTNILRWD